MSLERSPLPPPHAPSCLKRVEKSFSMAAPSMRMKARCKQLFSYSSRAIKNKKKHTFFPEKADCRVPFSNPSKYATISQFSNFRRKLEAVF